MLEIPSVLLLNCLGSYFYSIVECVGQPGSRHALLYYLSLGKLTYQALSPEEVQKKYADNAWGYQPVVIEDTQCNPLEIDSRFFNYLSEKHNVFVTEIDMNQNDLMYNLTNFTGDGQFSICNVDEYYIPASTTFYQKKHNKHFLMIKAVDQKNGMLEIIDSEKKQTYMMTFSDMEQAVYQSVYKRKLFYRIDCNSYADKTVRAEVLHNFLAMDRSLAHLTELINDVKIKLFSDDDRQKYYFKGYYYTILSKIIPYSQMVYHLLKDNDIEFKSKAEELVKEWRSLCSFMLFNMYKNNYKYDAVFKKLKNILEKEYEMERYIHFLH